MTITPREIRQMIDAELPTEEQDSADAKYLAYEYLTLRRCAKCRRLRVSGMICSFCGDNQ